MDRCQELVRWRGPATANGKFGTQELADLRVFDDLLITGENLGADEILFFGAFVKHRPAGVDVVIDALPVFEEISGVIGESLFLFFGVWELSVRIL